MFANSKYFVKGYVLAVLSLIKDFSQATISVIVSISVVKSIEKPDILSVQK